MPLVMALNDMALNDIATNVIAINVIAINVIGPGAMVRAGHLGASGSDLRGANVPCTIGGRGLQPLAG